MKRKRGAPRRFHLDTAEILRYHRRGMTLGEIGEPFGVSGAAVSYHLRRAKAATLRPGRRSDRDYSHLTSG